MRCKECGSERFVKNGSKNGNPYYKCKECGKQYSDKVVDSHLKSMAMALVCAGLSFRTVGTLLGYSNVCILNWVREFAKLNYSKPIPKGDIIIELDEMWHFLHQKNKLWIWKAYCRTTKQLIDWECGDRSTQTLARLYNRLKQHNVKIYFIDSWKVIKNSFHIIY